MNDVHASGVLSGTFPLSRRRFFPLLFLVLAFLVTIGTALPSLAASAPKGAVSTKSKTAQKKKAKRLYVQSIAPADERAALKERGISSGFGLRATSRKTTRLHKGIDIPAPRDSRIMAFNDGEVIFAGRKAAYGTMVLIRQIDGREALYAHMDKAVVKRGDTVKRGTHIGHVGRTGRATGYHLHFELIDEGENLDPALHVWLGSELVLGPDDLDPSRTDGQTRVAEPTIRQIAPRNL